jgi:hypothetical protein
MPLLVGLMRPMQTGFPDGKVRIWRHLSLAPSCRRTPRHNLKEF